MRISKAFALLSVCAALAACGGKDRSPVKITDAWSPAAPPGSSAIAVYAQIVSDQDDVLQGGLTQTADKAELHATSEEDGMVKMRPLDRLQLPAAQPVQLQPGGIHIMLTGVHEALPAGAQFPLTLRFAKAGKVPVTVKVIAPGGTPP